MQGYKNSDIEWIGSMPSDWKLDKIKYIANLRTYFRRIYR